MKQIYVVLRVTETARIWDVEAAFTQEEDAKKIAKSFPGAIVIKTYLNEKVA